MTETWLVVAAVVASAVVPTLIANAFSVRRHLLKPSVESEAATVELGARISIDQ